MIRPRNTRKKPKEGICKNVKMKEVNVSVHMKIEELEGGIYAKVFHGRGASFWLGDA